MISELDLRSLWTELDAYEREIAKETTTLSEVWVKMAQLKEKNEAETKEYVAAATVCAASLARGAHPHRAHLYALCAYSSLMLYIYGSLMSVGQRLTPSLSPSLPLCPASIMAQKEFTFVDPETDMIFNVGGQIFETTASVLTKDPYSVLAAYCRASENQRAPPPNEDGSPPAKTTLFESEPVSGIFFIDRDWWLFRHILTYLRSNVLPNEYETLKELYVEAAFYRLESLQVCAPPLPRNACIRVGVREHE